MVAGIEGSGTNRKGNKSRGDSRSAKCSGKRSYNVNISSSTNDNDSCYHPRLGGTRGKGPRAFDCKVTQ